MATELVDDTAKGEGRWLDDFHEAQRTARVIFGEMNHLIAACYRVGNERLGNTLTEYLNVLRESFETMNSAVGRDISEQAQRSWDQVGETLHALLGAAPTKTPDPKGV